MQETTSARIKVENRMDNIKERIVRISNTVPENVFKAFRLVLEKLATEPQVKHHMHVTYCNNFPVLKAGSYIPKPGVIVTSSTLSPPEPSICRPIRTSSNIPPIDAAALTKYFHQYIGALEGDYTGFPLTRMHQPPSEKRQRVELHIRNN